MGELKHRIIEVMEPKEEPPMEVMGWIPTSKRLPPEDTAVVVWDYENRIAVVVYRFVSVCDGQSHYAMTAGDEYGFCEYSVSHWMPLPVPPYCTRERT